jgi:hypothetical protein
MRACVETLAIARVLERLRRREVTYRTAELFEGIYAECGHRMRVPSLWPNCKLPPGEVEDMISRQLPSLMTNKGRERQVPGEALWAFPGLDKGAGKVSGLGAAGAAQEEDMLPTLTLEGAGGVLRTANATRGAILQACADYKASPSGAGDACTLALDLYPASQRGLQGLGAPTAESCDGTHPLAKAHGRLGAMLGAAAVRALAAAPMHCLRSF